MVRLIVCCVGIVSSLPAVDGLELVRSDGGERLTAGGTELLVLSTPWVANSDWKGIYRLEYNRDFALNGSRKGWFELSLSGERFESKLVPLTAGPESTVKGIPFRRGAIETESDMTLAAIALWHTADGVARRGEQVGGNASQFTPFHRDSGRGDGHRSRWHVALRSRGRRGGSGYPSAISVGIGQWLPQCTHGHVFPEVRSPALPRVQGRWKRGQGPKRWFANAWPRTSMSSASTPPPPRRTCMRCATSWG